MPEGINILCVDDEPNVLSSARWALVDNGWQIHTAGSVGVQPRLREAQNNLLLHPYSSGTSFCTKGVLGPGSPGHTYKCGI